MYKTFPDSQRGTRRFESPKRMTRVATSDDLCVKAHVNVCKIESSRYEIRDARRKGTMNYASTQRQR